MVTAEDVVELYTLLAEAHIRMWMTGGWGIDALLGEPTRAHKDLDVLVLRDDIVSLIDLLERHGFRLEDTWSENQFVQDRDGNEIMTAFVLTDSGGRQFDIHAIRLDEEGNGVGLWVEEEPFVFSKRDLEGEGTVAGQVVPCITLESQLVCHAGYPLPGHQERDLALLRKKFGMEGA